MNGWIDEIDRRGPWDVGLQLGLQARAAGHLGPCPACGQDRRSAHDARAGAIFVLPNRKGWKCGHCGAKGGAVQLAAFVVLGEVPRKGDERWRALWLDLVTRGLCAGPETGLPAPRPLRPVIATPAEGPPPRPPAAEVSALWDACQPVDADHQVREWLTGRALDPERIARLDLARALPVRAALPRWAGVGGPDGWRPWTSGWRLLVRAYDARGAVQSLRARWIRPDAERPMPYPKAGAAAAGTGSSRGLVYADELAQQVLRTSAPPSWWPSDVPLRVVVLEGEPDWLTWASRETEDTTAPAVLGVYNGSWNDEIAARLPFGARVEVRTHQDEAGRGYQRRIVESCGRRCDVRVRRAA